MFQMLRILLGVLSFGLFVANNPEARFFLALLLFFVFLGYMHYVLWGRSLAQEVQNNALAREPVLHPDLDRPDTAADL